MMILARKQWFCGPAEWRARWQTWAMRASVFTLVGLLISGAGLRGQTVPADKTLGSTTTVTGGDFLALQRRYIDLLGQARAAVVKINIVGADGITYLSTGFFISKEGYLITANAHLLQDAVRVIFEYDGVPYIADVAGVDLVTNIALLRAPKLPGAFGVLDLADSPELPPLGTMLLAVTCKRGDEPGPSPGILQGYNAKYGDQKLPALYLRTNIPDDGAESGSPVFDLEGKLVGLMVVTLPETRSSLVLPTRALIRVREDLLDHGHVQYGHFGFSGKQFVTAETGSLMLIDDVEYGGPAATAGLKVGDVLLAIGDTTISTDQDITQLAFFARPGQYVTVRVRRDGKEMEMPLQVGEMKLETPAAPASGTGAAPAGTSGNSTAAPTARAGSAPVSGGNGSVLAPSPDTVANPSAPPPVIPPVISIGK
jgi:serine protease Do